MVTSSGTTTTLSHRKSSLEHTLYTCVAPRKATITNGKYTLSNSAAPYTTFTRCDASLHTCHTEHNRHHVTMQPNFEWRPKNTPSNTASTLQGKTAECSAKENTYRLLPCAPQETPFPQQQQSQGTEYNRKDLRQRLHSEQIPQATTIMRPTRN